MSGMALHYVLSKLEGFKDVDPSGWAVAVTVAYHVSIEGKPCTAGRQRLATLCGKSEKSVSRGIAWCRDNGILEVRQYRDKKRSFNDQFFLLKGFKDWLQKTGQLAREKAAEKGSEFDDIDPWDIMAHGSIPVGHPVSHPVSHPVGHNVPLTSKEPDKEPGKEPDEKERASAIDSDLGENEGEESSASAMSPKQIETAFKRSFHKWPTYVTDSEPEARKVWWLLSDHQRISAEDRIPDYLEAGSAKGRNKICSFAVYLRELRWEKLPERAPYPVETHVSAKPHGKPWNAFRLHELINGPSEFPPPGTAFLREQLASDPKLQKMRELELGYPIVNEMTAKARQCYGQRVPIEFQAISDGFKHCPATDDNPLWIAWQDAHRARNWPVMDRPPSGYAWLPVPVDPESYSDMKAFVRDALQQLQTDLAALNEIEETRHDDSAA